VTVVWSLMYLTEILSEWILSQWLFFKRLLSQLILLNWENIIFGSLPWIIALLGVISAFFGPHILWRQQQTKELKTLANIFILDLERVYNSNYTYYLTYKEKQDDNFGNALIIPRHHNTFIFYLTMKFISLIIVYHPGS
jgi:hypothetical protein